MLEVYIYLLENTVMSNFESNISEGATTGSSYGILSPYFSRSFFFTASLDRLKSLSFFTEHSSIPNGQRFFPNMNSGYVLPAVLFVATDDMAREVYD